MEPVETLTQKQRKRRLRAINEAHDIIKECLDDIKDKRAMLLAAIDVTPLDETVNKTLSYAQLDDYIKCYSQVYARIAQANGLVHKKLVRMIAVKKAKEATP